MRCVGVDAVQEPFELVVVVGTHGVEACGKALLDVRAAFMLGTVHVVEVVVLALETIDLGLLFNTSVRPAEVEELGYRRGKLPQLE